MNSLFEATRLVFYHKQATSARTLFLRFNDTVCAFDTLPSSARLSETPEIQPVTIHPAPLITQAEQRLGLPHGSLEIEKEFYQQVEALTGLITIYLMRFTALDAPHEIVAPSGGHFISLMEARDLPPVELELLRRAYAVIMEG